MFLRALFVLLLVSVQGLSADVCDGAEILDQKPGTTVKTSTHYSTIDSNPMFEITGSLGKNGELYINIISKATRGSAGFSVPDELAKIVDHFSEKTRRWDAREGKSVEQSMLFGKRVKSVSVTLGGYRVLDDQGHVTAMDPELETLNTAISKRRKSSEFIDEADVLYHGVLATSLRQVVIAGLLGPANVKASNAKMKNGGYSEVTLKFKRKG